MGFCSGTEIFDPVADDILHIPSFHMGDKEKKRVIRVLIEALESHDWDCQSDSRHYNHPLVYEVFRELHPDWFAE